MVMIVADPILEAGRRSSRLNAPDEPLGDKETQGVVDRLQGDRADLRPDDVGYGVGRDVRLTGDRSQDRQPLGGNLNAALTKESGRIPSHLTIIK